MNLHVEKQSVYAHADGVGAPKGGRDKCGDVYKRGFGGGREATHGFAHKADIYFVADGDKMDESTTSSITLEASSSAWSAKSRQSPSRRSQCSRIFICFS